MNLNFNLVLVFLVLIPSLIAFFAILQILFPGRIAKIQTEIGDRPGRSFLLGLVNFAFFLAIGLGLFALSGKGAIRVLAVIAVIYLAALTAAVCFGLASVVQLIGGRLAMHETGFKRSLWGSLALIMASYLPFVGWFLLFPYAGLLGFGGLVLSVFNKTRQPLLEMEEKPS